MKKNIKSVTVNFPPVPSNAKQNLPLQYKGSDISERGPIGFYRNIDKLYTGLVFRDVQGNVTYIDVDVGVIKNFDANFWADNFFVFQPQLTCLHIKNSVKNVTVNKC